jgi:hypothetical protein
MYMNLLKRMVLVLAAGVVVACGGSSGGGDVTLSGITASGTITGFGSIFVNGIEFETGAANVSIDDNPGIESDLQLGMVVTVSGSVNSDGRTGTATTVTFDDEVQGPIATVPVDPTGDGLVLQFTVLGVTVVADRTSTVFDDGVSFATLAQGDFVEVSGFIGQGGLLNATRIEGKGAFTPGISEIEIKGLASNVVGITFSLGSFSVDTSGADLSGVPGGVVTTGMEVEVKGTLTGTSIAASRVKQEDDLFAANVDKVSLEGIITSYVNDGNFQISGQQVDASSALFSPANLVLANGIEVEVEGPVVNGVLVAIKAEARGGNIKIAARVLSVGQNSLTLQFNGGTVDVVVDSQTSLRDDLGIFDPYALGNVVATDFLEISGSINGNGIITAEEIRRDNASDDILQGPADSCIGTTLAVLGIDFTLQDGLTTYQDQLDNPIANAANFCAAVNASSLFVKVRDDLSPNGIADEAELEN